MERQVADEVVRRQGHVMAEVLGAKWESTLADVVSLGRAGVTIANPVVGRFENGQQSTGSTPGWPPLPPTPLLPSAANASSSSGFTCDASCLASLDREVKNQNVLRTS